MNSIKVVGESCCGCYGCEQICSVKAISFHQNEEGFEYPVVGDNCIQCGRCVAVCPIVNIKNNREEQKGFAAYLRDEQLLLNSSSGGAFYALAENILQKNGVVYGCIEETPGFTRHIKIDRIDQLKLLQGSKYVESDLKNVFSDVRDALSKGWTVLFSGTPCQVAGVLNFVGYNDNLFTVDIVCHGVPSRKLYLSYLKYIEQKKHIAVSQFKFRSKSKHQWSLTYSIEYCNKKREEHIASMSPYYSHFLKAYNYRESCYKCPYASISRPGDVTLADFWGIEKVEDCLMNPNGVSAVIVNNKKGEKILNECSSKLVMREVAVLDIVNNNGQLRSPTKRPTVRDNYYELLNDKGFTFLEQRLKDRKELLVDTIKDIIPNRIRKKIKSFVMSVG